MQNVQVFHVGSPNPMVVRDADFRTGVDGEALTVYRGDEIVAQFPAGKWSAVVKMDAPTTSTSPSRVQATTNMGPRATAHTYTAACAGHHGLNESCPTLGRTS